MSISPITRVPARIGTTISDFVDVKHARYLASLLTSATTSVLPDAAAAPHTPFPIVMREPVVKILHDAGGGFSGRTGDHIADIREGVAEIHRCSSRPKQ